MHRTYRDQARSSKTHTQYPLSHLNATSTSNSTVLHGWLASKGSHNLKNSAKLLCAASTRERRPPQLDCLFLWRWIIEYVLMMCDTVATISLHRALPFNCDGVIEKAKRNWKYIMHVGCCCSALNINVIFSLDKSTNPRSKIKTKE